MVYNPLKNGFKKLVYAILIVFWTIWVSNIMGFPQSLVSELPRRASITYIPFFLFQQSEFYFKCSKKKIFDKFLGHKITIWKIRDSHRVTLGILHMCLLYV